MADANEIRALRASLLGVLDSAAALDAIKSRVMAIEPGTDIAPLDLDELGRCAGLWKGCVHAATFRETNAACYH